MKTEPQEKRKKIQDFKNKFVAKKLGVTLKSYTDAKIEANAEANRNFNL